MYRVPQDLHGGAVRPRHPASLREGLQKSARPQTRACPASPRSRRLARRRARAAADATKGTGGGGCHAPPSTRKCPLSDKEVRQFVDRALERSRASLVRDLRGFLLRFAPILASVRTSEPRCHAPPSARKRRSHGGFRRKTGSVSHVSLGDPRGRDGCGACTRPPADTRPSNCAARRAPRRAAAVRRSRARGHAPLARAARPARRADVFVEAGRLEILDGFKRVRAARALGWRRLRARVADVDAVEAKMRLVALHDRRGLTELEEAWLVRSLYRDDGLAARDRAALAATRAGCAGA